jgi:hypothetical protein
LASIMVLNTGKPFLAFEFAPMPTWIDRISVNCHIDIGIGIGILVTVSGGDCGA